MADKLSKIIDGTEFSRLSTADQAKYERQDDGTYKLMGDPTPSADVGLALPLFANPDELTKLGEPMRKYYEEVQDGKFQLRGFEDVTALKNAVGHVRSERDLAREKLKAFEGFTAEEYQRLKEVEAKVKKEAELQRSEFDRQFTEASEQYKKMISDRDDRIKRMSRDLDSALIERQAAIDINAASGSTELLLPHIRSRAEVREIEGRHIAVILGEDGNPRLKKGANKATDFLPIRDYVEELKEDRRFAGAFSGTGTSGSGATPPGATRPGDVPATVSRGDMRAIGEHAESIAKGLTKVV